MTLIDSEMAALMLDRSARHVQRLIKQGVLTNKGPRRNVIRIEFAEVEALAEKRKRGS